MTRTKTTDAERLARWLHRTWRRLFPGKAGKPWRQLQPLTRRDYETLCEEILRDPPPVLRRAVRRLEGDGE